MRSTAKLALATLAFATGSLFFYSMTRLGTVHRSKPVAQPAVVSSNPDLGPQTSIEDKAHEIKALEIELQKKPNHVPILLRLAQIQRESGKVAEASKYLQQILAQEPRNLDARLELGRALFDLGDVSGAIEQTKLILKENPSHTEALYNLGAIYGNLNNETMAREYWTRTIASNPNSESARQAKENLTRLGTLP